MIKDITYKEKFSLLKKWMPAIVEDIKKDLKNEHLKKDWGFVKQHFPGKNVNKLSTDELAEAYMQVIQTSENAEELAEFITNRWLLKHTDVYHFFETELTKVSPDFSELEILDKEKSIQIMEEGARQFGALKTYLFAIVNSVVFPKEVFDLLLKRAETDFQQSAEQESSQKELKSLNDVRASYEQQIARLTDKYEKKLSGLQKKYAIDVEGLKKQIAALQRKLTLN